MNKDLMDERRNDGKRKCVEVGERVVMRGGWWRRILGNGEKWRMEYLNFRFMDG